MSFLTENKNQMNRLNHIAISINCPFNQRKFYIYSPRFINRYQVRRTCGRARNTKRWIKREEAGNTPTGLKQEKTRTVPNHTVADGKKR